MTGAAAVLATACVGAGMALMAAWMEAPPEDRDDVPIVESRPEPSGHPATAQRLPGEVRLKVRCEECGVVQSIRRGREFSGAPAFYETTVRLSDGSTRVFSDGGARLWRPGERIVLIGGGNPLAQ